MKKQGIQSIFHIESTSQWFLGGALFFLPFSLIICNVFIILFISFSFFERNRIKINKIILFFLAFFIIATLSLLWTSNLEYGLKSIETKLSLLVFPLTLLSSNTFKKATYNTLLNVFIGAVVICCLICLIYAFFYSFQVYSKWVSFDRMMYTRVVGSLHPVYLSLYILFVMCILTYRVFNVKSVKKRIYTYILLGFLLANLIILVSKTILLILVILSLFFILTSFKRQKRVLLLFMFVFCIIGASVFFTNKKLIYKRFKEPYAYLSKQQQFTAASQVFLQNPIIGVGIGDADNELIKMYKKLGFKESYQARYNAHNQYLQTAISLGSIGLIVLLLTFGIPFYYAIKRKHYLYALFLFIFSTAIMTESMLERQKGVVFYALFNALFAQQLFAKKVVEDVNEEKP